MNQRVLNWLNGRDTGMSSMAIVSWMERDSDVAPTPLSHPHDGADLGRCIRLLDIEPSYRARIGEMALCSPVWARLVARWDELEASYYADMVRRYCYHTNDLIHELIYGKESADRTREFRKKQGYKNPMAVDMETQLARLDLHSRPHRGQLSTFEAARFYLIRAAMMQSSFWNVSKVPGTMDTYQFSARFTAGDLARVFIAALQPYFKKHARKG